jgi:hypothetical protein
MQQSVAHLSKNMADSNRRVALLYRKTLKSLPYIVKVCWLIHFTSVPHPSRLPVASWEDGSIHFLMCGSCLLMLVNFWTVVSIISCIA